MKRLRHELAFLLSSELPGDQATLERRLAELSQDEVREALYQIAVAARPPSLMLLIKAAAMGIGLLFSIYQTWLFPSLAIPLLLCFIILFSMNTRAIQSLNRNLRYRRARKAVFYLARFNDVRAIDELLRYRQFRTRSAEEAAVTDRIETELTRLFDELSGQWFIPGSDALRQKIAGEFFSFGNAHNWSMNRVYFYISVLRFLSHQSSPANDPLLERIVRRTYRDTPRTMVRDAVLVMLQHPVPEARIAWTPLTGERTLLRWHR